MPKQTKTNAVRLLEKAGIPYSTHEYHFDENDLAATHVAEELGEDIARVFKTLVLRGERTGLFVCVVPGDKEVDLKKAAHAARRQEGRPHSHEGAAAPDRLYTRRLLANRHEKADADLLPFHSHRLRHYICKRRYARPPGRTRTTGPDRLCRRLDRRPHKRLTMNTFGTLFRLTDFGESHGPAIGGVIDGMPPGDCHRFRPRRQRTCTSPPGTVNTDHPTLRGGQGRMALWNTRRQDPRYTHSLYNTQQRHAQ